jgi:hypothetical protein
MEPTEGIRSPFAILQKNKSKPAAKNRLPPIINGGIDLMANKLAR